MTTTVSLTQLADLALGTPEVGAVNFNVLHTLLHAIIQKVGIQDVKANINEADKNFLVRKKDDPDTFSRTTEDDRDSAITGLTDDSFVKDRPLTSSGTPYHQLEHKVAQLEKKFEGLNDLPTNKELMEKTKSKGDSDNVRPVNDMWQAIQLKNRVDANENGIEKLMSLVQDMMSEIGQLKDANEELRKQMQDAKNIEDLMKRLKELEDMTNSLNDQFSQFPSPDTFSDFVTWSALEDALKGLKENLEELRKPPVVMEMSSQTEAVKSRPASAQMPSRPQSSRSRAGTPGPSEALQDLLERLGKLTDRHDVLEDRVDKIENELKNKADKADLEGIGVPDDLLKQLKDLQEQIERIKKLAGKVESLDAMISSLSTTPGSDNSAAPTIPASLLSTLEQTIHNLSGEQGLITAKLEDLEAKLSALEASVNGRIENLEKHVSGGFEDLQDQFESLKEIALSRPEPPLHEPDQLIFDENVPKDEVVKRTSSELQRTSSEINSLGNRLKYLTQDSNKQLSELRKKMHAVEGLVEQLEGQLAKMAAAAGKTRSPKDSDAVTRLQQALHNLQSELERLDKLTQVLTDENSRKQRDIEALYEMCNKLEENKADKDFVQSEVEVKADRKLVDGKVNRSLFDQTNDELKKLISDILDKLSGHEDDWKKAVSQLNNDLDGKLDRLEFGPIKDELDRQLRALLKKLKGMHFPQYESIEDEAAGIRKQLLTRYHCISCDRNVDMAPQGPIPSIPAPAGLPATKSTRPYTTFELEQIRQHAKSDMVRGRNITNFERALKERQFARLRMNDDHAFMFGKDIAGRKYRITTPVQQPQVDVMDLYATQRACGGSHTMTYPHKRITRMTHMNNLFRDDEPVPTYRNELDIQGADGHVYKGRQTIDANRLPNLQSAPGTTMSGRSPTMPRRAQTSMEYKDTVAASPRPNSARLSRPSSGRHGVNSPRTMSARLMAQHQPQPPSPTPHQQQPPTHHHSPPSQSPLPPQQTTEVPTAEMTDGSVSPTPGQAYDDHVIDGGVMIVHDEAQEDDGGEGAVPPARTPSPANDGGGNEQVEQGVDG